MAYVALATKDLAYSKPKRIEGHTSNVETPVLYAQFGKVSATPTAGDTFAIPHKLTNVKHITITPTNAAAATSLFGAASGAATLGAYITLNGYVINWEALGASAIAGATTVTLGSTGSAVADVYNGCWLDIRHTDGSIQTVQITDYIVTTKVAHLSEGLSAAVTTANLYRVRGDVYTSPTAAGAEAIFSVQVIGSFE